MHNFNVIDLSSTGIKFWRYFPVIRGEIIWWGDLNFVRIAESCVCLLEGLFRDEIRASKKQLFAFLAELLKHTCVCVLPWLKMDDLGKMIYKRLYLYL